MGTKSERQLLSSIICHAMGLRIKTKVRDLKQKYRDTIEDQQPSLLASIEWSGNSINTLDKSEETKAMENEDI